MTGNFWIFDWDFTVVAKYLWIHRLLITRYCGEISVGWFDDDKETELWEIL